MKFFLQFLLSFLLVAQTQFPQWTNQNPVPDGNDLWSTFFVDDSIGWIVGSDGFIKKTTNAGNEWVQQNSGTNLILKSVQFVNKNTGWICGESGLILKTTNGGVNWSPLTSGTIQHLTDIHFCTPDIGYVTGFGGTILKTTNGGSSWTSLSSGTSNDLYGVDFVDALIGYVVGGENANLTFLKTTDGGTSWIDKSSGISSIWGYYLAIEFIDANTGFIGCGGTLLKTTDGGNTWSQYLSTIELHKTEKDSKEHLNVYPINTGITSIYFRDANNGWYLSWTTDNYIYRTTNGGISWERERHYWEHSLLSVFVTQGGTGLAVGAYGLIYMKEESAFDWSRLLSGKSDKIQSIYFFDGNNGWAGGTRWGNPYTSMVLKTTNGGKLWKTQLENGLASYSRCFYFLNESLGWIVKSINAPQELLGAGLYRTTNGGKNWILIQPSGDFSSVFFINQDTGWVTSDYYNESGIYKSTDGGITLVKKSSISSSSVYFLNDNIGWATSVSGILKSTDGGETWMNKSNSSGSYIRFYDSNVGICIGGVITVSTDGGESWNNKNGPSLQKINFINSTTILGYTSTGDLYKTTDLGDTWVSLNVGLGTGQTSFFINEYTGWVGGLNGTMFKYEVEPPPPPIPPIWLNQISIKDAGGTESSKTLIFGQHKDATDSIDVSLGEYEIPPVPPTGIFDARFNLPTSPLVSSLTDYRDSSMTEIIWKITFQPGSSGYPITFTWDSTAFPEGTFYLKDRINGSFVNVNMKNQSSYVLTDPEITSLKISYKGLSKVITVNNEWNMISVPLLAEDMSLSNLFPTATSFAYGFEGGYVVNDTLVGGKGYWLMFDMIQQIQIFGSRMGNTLPLQTGWNMFGVYEKDVPINQITTTPPGIVTTYYFGFDDGYYIADTLKSGKGYWVSVTQNGVLNLNSSGLFKDAIQLQSDEINKSKGKILITDCKGKSITLFATAKETNLDLYELPPKPPEGIFDARYSSGRMAEDISTEKIIQISSADYPIRVRVEGLKIKVRDRINGTLLNEELSDGEEIRIINGKIKSIEVLGSLSVNLPVIYQLSQNYPNPFNPNTTIEFSLPENVNNVRLSVYNALGEKITDLVNAAMTAGKYSFQWNAQNVASGTYFYELRTDNFVSVKKMLLMK